MALRRGFRTDWPRTVVLAVLLLTAGIRIRLLPVPLERDEGEYGYAGQLLLQGVPPYAEAYNMKMPGIYAAYAVILLLFGETCRGIHSGLLVVNGITIVLLFLLGKKLYDPATGAVSATAFGILSLSQSVQGVFSHAEHFVVLAVLSGVLLLLRALELNRLSCVFWSGLLFGTAFLMKQHAAAFFGFAALYLVWSEYVAGLVRWRRCISRCGLLAVGMLLPFGFTCLALYLAGVFGKFWFWTFKYSAAYVSQIPVSMAFTIFREKIPNIIGPSWPIWALAAIGLIALWRDRSTRPHTSFVLLFLGFSLLSICPGFYFREHYFLLLLPALSLLAGVGARWLAALTARLSSPRLRAVGSAVSILAFVLPIYFQREFLFRLTPIMVSRSTYGSNPFPESLEIARYLRESTPEEARIAVIGSEPQIYFYSRRRSATGYIYTYGLMEKHEFALHMQEEMIREIMAARPEVMIAVNVSTSWLARPDSNTRIFDWFSKYSQDGFDLVGIVDIHQAEATDYYWGPEAASHSPRTKDWIAIYRRRQGS